jgi:hypothetical protein
MSGIVPFFFSNVTPRAADEERQGDGLSQYGTAQEISERSCLLLRLMMHMMGAANGNAFGACGGGRWRDADVRVGNEANPGSTAGPDVRPNGHNLTRAPGGVAEPRSTSIRQPPLGLFC